MTFKNRFVSLVFEFIGFWIELTNVLEDDSLKGGKMGRVLQGSSTDKSNDEVDELNSGCEGKVFFVL